LAALLASRIAWCQDIEALKAGLCLYGEYELITKPESPDALGYPIGSLNMTWDSSYRFRVERDRPGHWKGSANDFFALHPKGRIEVKYASGVTAETRLEDLPDESLVATVTFVAGSGGSRKDYRIIANRTYRRLRFADDAMPYTMTKGWLNYWR
jgi:hypothetical protein